MEKEAGIGIATYPASNCLILPLFVLRFGVQGDFKQGPNTKSTKTNDTYNVT